MPGRVQWCPMPASSCVVATTASAAPTRVEQAGGMCEGVATVAALLVWQGAAVPTCGPSFEGPWRWDAEPEALC